MGNRIKEIEREAEELFNEIMKQPNARDLLAKHFEEHNPTWGKLFRENKMQELITEIDKEIAAAESFD